MCLHRDNISFSQGQTVDREGETHRKINGVEREREREPDRQTDCVCSVGFLFALVTLDNVSPPTAMSSAKGNNCQECCCANYQDLLSNSL
jgi:hypothetical protein